MFVPGFNVWYIVAPVLVVAMGVIGYLKYQSYWDGSRWRKIIYKQYDDWFLLSLSVIFSIIFWVLLVAESWKKLLRCFGGDTIGVLPIVRTAFVIILIIAGYCFVLFFTGKATSKIRKSILKRSKPSKKDSPKKTPPA